MKNESKVIRDWTQETLVVDVVNSLGERYHFEVEPNANPNSVASRPTDYPIGGNRVMNVTFPIAVQLDMFKPAGD